MYWWVNQNQTAKHEIGGSYLWSPKRNRNDSYNQFYENMRLAEPGDVVFSFYDQHIQHLGIVQSRAVTAPKPTEFARAGHYWSEEGWLVPVQWRVLPTPYRPKDIISVLRPLFPAKYSPLQQSGDGLWHRGLALRIPIKSSPPLARADPLVSSPRQIETSKEYIRPALLPGHLSS